MLYIRKNDLGEEAFNLFRQVSRRGYHGRLRPRLPDKERDHDLPTGSNLSNPSALPSSTKNIETRYRQRYIDLIER